MYDKMVHIHNNISCDFNLLKQVKIIYITYIHLYHTLIYTIFKYILYIYIYIKYNMYINIILILSL